MAAVQNNLIHARRAPWFFHSANGAALPFEYPDGAIAGKLGGQIWNYKNTSTTGYSNAPSTWMRRLARLWSQQGSW